MMMLVPDQLTEVQSDTMDFCADTDTEQSDMFTVPPPLPFQQEYQVQQFRQISK